MFFKLEDNSCLTTNLLNLGSHLRVLTNFLANGHSFQIYKRHYYMFRSSLLKYNGELYPDYCKLKACKKVCLNLS